MASKARDQQAAIPEEELLLTDESTLQIRRYKYTSSGSSIKSFYFITFGPLKKIDDQMVQFGTFERKKKKKLQLL